MQIEYEIKPGDTLSSIIYNLTGNKSSAVYNEIAKNNNIADINKIQVGQKIKFNQADYATDEYKASHPNEFASAKSTGQSSQNQNATGNIPSSNQGSVSPVSGYVGSYSPSYEYEICKPEQVNGWQPQKNYSSFNIKENAGDKIAAVNNSVKACCEEIDGIVSSLKTLRVKMGENKLTNDQVDRIVRIFESKKQDLITKNFELIEACNQVIGYVYQNKTEKTEEARSVAAAVANINIYKG